MAVASLVFLGEDEEEEEGSGSDQSDGSPGGGERQVSEA